jgi:hypothetical protein
MPRHNHQKAYNTGGYVGANSPVRSFVKGNFSDLGEKSGAPTDRSATGYNDEGFIQNTGDGQSHTNLQPYITCYLWKRTT